MIAAKINMEKKEVGCFGPPPEGSVSVKECNDLIEKYLEWMKDYGSQTVHSGRAGLALTLLYLAELECSDDKKKVFVARARMIELQPAEPAEAPEAEKNLTFLGGSSGIFCLMGALGDDTKQQEMTKFLVVAAEEAKVKDGISNGLWNGRVGVLYSLLYAEERFFGQNGCQLQLKSAQLDLFDIIMEETDWNWTLNGKQCIGLIHGCAGIVAVLWRAFYRFTDEERRGRAGGTEGKLRHWVKYICSFQMPGGNFPSCVGNNEGTLVQLRHGAPGVIVFMSEVENVSLSVMRCAADCVWNAGLLTKGVGLFHGVSGNAFALLAVFQKTGEQRWLNMAHSFARFAVDRCQTAFSDLVMESNQPFGLVNGIGGLICLLGGLKYIMEAPTNRRKMVRLPFF